MEIRQLRNFIQIAELGSFSSAARALFIAQPALSQQVAQLEAELGQPLLVRRPTGVRLTEQGEVFYGRAQRVLKELADMGAAVQEVAGTPRGRVALGLPQSTALQFAMPLLSAARKKFPLVQIEFFDELSASLLNGLTSGRFDLAVLVDDDQAALLRSEPLIEETLYLVSRPDLAPTGPAIDLASLAAFPLALPGCGHGVRDLVEQSVRQAGTSLPTPCVTANSMSIMRQAVLDGLAHSVMPWGALPEELRNGTLKPTPMQPSLVRRAYLCTARDAVPTAAAEAVRALLRETVHRRIQAGEWPGARICQTTAPLLP